MFRRLVSNLPFNPSLINQVGFYADRLRGETVVRRMSFVMMALVVAVQSLAVISPPERSLAASPNHILNGLTTKNDLLAAYDNPTSDIKDIFTRFSLSRADIAALPTNPNVTIRSNDGSDWWTTGRTSLWNYGKVADVYKRAEVPVQYRGENTTQTSDDAYIYARPLRAWDIVNPYNTYKAFQGKSSATGQDFWILLDCGNITWKGTWKTPPPPPPDTPPPPPPLPEPKVPALEIRKSIVNQPTSYKPGDSYTYKIEYRNKIIGSTAEDAYIRDQLAIKNFTVVSPRNLTITPTGYLNHAVGDLPGSSTFRVLEIKVQLKNPLASGTEVCNEASLVAKNASTAKTKAPVCAKVITPCPYDPTIPNVNNDNCTKPVVVCKVVDAEVNLTTRTVNFRTSIDSTNPANTTIFSYVYDFGDDSALITKQSAALTDTQSHTYEAGSYTASVRINYATTGTDGRQETTCSTPIDFEADKPLGQAKTVKNVTQNLTGADAEDSIVKAGDVLEYTLSTSNTQNYERRDILISDYIGDVLDYGTLDISALEASGGSFDKEKSKISWRNVTIPANGVVQSVFRVTILDPVPATNRPSATSGDFDCSITNVYGDSTTLDIQCPVVKGIETLPNTGPGTSMIALTGITGVVGYFFARSRLLAKELQLIRTDYAVTGGM